ncbi:MAG: tagaturonate reductase [Chitinophagaceae bacterium]
MLTRFTLKNISSQTDVRIPSENIFDLPEKVLQFGTGVLLRGLPDYFIDKANRAGIFNGRIVVVKSTDTGDSSVFEKQDNLYTVCVRGISDGVKIEENIVNASISRVVAAKTEWGKILQCAHNPEMQLIISNTTEVGISFVKDDIWQSPPVSFPGKLLSFLYERYKTFHGSEESGMVIVPTELIPDNGKKLESIVLELAHLNGLEESFMDWLENSNHFCNSLVDRIVPGLPATSLKEALESQLHYKDELLIMAEVYRLWAIESSSERVTKILSFSKVDEGVAIAPDITKFRELKLRLLNGTHTLTCALAILLGHTTVKEAMEDQLITGYMQKLMMNEIIPAVINDHISKEEAMRFATQVLDRFRNPYLDHKWSSISTQYSSKMKLRNLPLLLKYHEKYESNPELVALGFAAYLLIMKLEFDGKIYKGEIDGLTYVMQDDKAGYFAGVWKNTPVEALVEKVLQEETLWEKDLTELNGFSLLVSAKLKALMRDGATATIRNTIKDKTVIQS